MTTYTELLQQKRVPCSCCGRMTEPNCAFVTTRGRPDLVEWIQCPECWDSCTKWRHTSRVSCSEELCEMESCRRGWRPGGE